MIASKFLISSDLRIVKGVDKKSVCDIWHSEFEVSLREVDDDSVIQSIDIRLNDCSRAQRSKLQLRVDLVWATDVCENCRCLIDQLNQRQSVLRCSKHCQRACNL